MYTIEEIINKTDGGRTIIEGILPQSKESFTNPFKTFTVEDNNRTYVCSVFKDRTDTFWFVFYKGQTKTPIQLVQDYYDLSYKETLLFIAVTYIDNHKKDDYKNSKEYNTIKAIESINQKKQ